jgi:membrane-associated protein
MPFTFLGATFAEILKWVLHNGYPIIFLGMIIEGPTIIAAASFATTMGYFSLPIIFILGILGDIVGDFIWYVFGYFGRITVVKKYGHLFGASDERMEKLRELLEKHPKKIIAAIKLSPLLPVPGLIVTGSSHMPPKKFAIAIGSIILPKTILFMALGYFFGHIYEKISAYINNGIYTIGILLIAGYFVHYFYKKIAAKISEKLESN